MPESGRDEFERAVADFEVRELPLDDEPLELAARSLEWTGLFLLGESHGIAETPNAIATLVRRLGVRAVGLEWSHDEIGDVVQEVFETGRIDLDALWKLPIGGDLFASDGRFTAGHVAMLEDLVGSGELEHLILFDRLDKVDPLPASRDEAMAERLLAERRSELRTLAVPGFYHVAREPNGGAPSMAMHIGRTLPGVANGVLVFSAGNCQARGEHPVRVPDRAVDAVFHVGHATPAVVPAK